jgi:hypothetical protein
MARRTWLTVLGVAGALFAGGFFATWRYPYLLDRARFKDVDRQCSGLMTISGPTSDGSVSERHCCTGAGLYATERRWILESEYASDGWVILVGSGINPSPGNDTRPIDYAFVRTPGGDGAWYGALAGTATLHDGKLGDGEASLDGLTALQVGTKGDGTLDVDRSSTPPKAEATISTLWLGGLVIGGSGCNPEDTRCAIDLTSNARTVRAYMHASAPMNGATPAPIDSGFLFVDAGPGTPLRLAPIPKGSGSTAQVRAGLDVALHLRGLGPLVDCATQPSRGSVAIRWSR